MTLVDLFRLTRRQYYFDFFITPPLTVILLVHSISRVEGLAAWLIWIFCFCAGLILWTLYEYALHRFVLHGLPIGREIHAMHHKNQLDYIAQPPWLTLSTYILSWAIFGVHANALMVGASVGYCAYAAAHTAFHYARFQRGPLLWRLDQRHVLHHRDGDVCYGVTVDWWDRLFGTEATNRLEKADFL